MSFPLYMNLYFGFANVQIEVKIILIEVQLSNYLFLHHNPSPFLYLYFACYYFLVRTNKRHSVHYQ